MTWLWIKSFLRKFLSLKCCWASPSSFRSLASKARNLLIQEDSNGLATTHKDIKLGDKTILNNKAKNQTNKSFNEVSQLIEISMCEPP